MADGNPSITPEVSVAVLQGTFPGDLGIDLVDVSPERAEARMTVDRRHLHAGGVVHGGAWAAFADTVAAWATMRTLPPGTDFTTVEMKMNVFTAARTGDVLVGVAEPLHIGSRTQAWEVRVHKGEKLAAVFVCTQMVL